MPSCTFAQLREILLGLGFQLRSPADKPAVFEHGPASARLVLDAFAEPLWTKLGLRSSGLR